MCLSISSCADDFSLVVVLNSQLREIDLSSLESISGGGILYFNNPQLCYVGNFSTYIENPTAQHQCIVSPFRRDPQTCSESCVSYHLTIPCSTLDIKSIELDHFSTWCLANVSHIHELLINVLFNWKQFTPEG